jgi:hypothetical protein
MEELMDVFEIPHKVEEQKIEHQFHSQHLQYCEELWDSLDNISTNSKKSCRIMVLLVDFLSNLAKQAEGFSMSVNKLVDSFEKDLKYDKPNRDTTGI